MNSKEFFYKTQETIFKLLKDRHYIVDTIDKVENFDEDIELTFMKKNGEKVLVLWHIEEGIGITQIKKWKKQLDEEEIKNAIIIKWGKLTPNANSTISELSFSCTIQIFDVEDVLNNITKHTLVPKHELLCKEEVDKLLKAYRIKKSQLPRILTTDPVIRYYGWEPGNIVKITRKNGEIVYRCIIKK